ncbi:MAG: transposase [Candidatus Micrarchaeota archaeon]
MGDVRVWKYRLYASKSQQKELASRLYSCKDLWNNLLEYTKKHYDETGRLPARKELYLRTKGSPLYSQVAQNVADRLSKSLKGMLARRRAGRKAGFPRFKTIERLKSFTYPQFGFRLGDKLQLSGIGEIPIKKHREICGRMKTLTLKKSPSGKWFAVFTTEVEAAKPEKKEGHQVGLDLGIEHFAHLSDGDIIENPRHLKRVEGKLGLEQTRLSRKKKGGKNRDKSRMKFAIAYEKLRDRRRDFLHKVSRNLVNKYSFIAMEKLDVSGLAGGFLAKSVLDCDWAEFVGMLRYKAAEAGCEVVLVDPAHTTQLCSGCGVVRKKSLAERWHICSCGAYMHRDLNAAINILDRATLGHRVSNAWGEGSYSLVEPRSPAI